MRSSSLLGWVIATLLLTSSAEAFAGGFHISIFGGRRTGMLANLGAPDDGTALFHNPAGLADQKGYRMHVSGSAAFLNTEFTLQALDPLRFPLLDEESYPQTDEGYYRDPIGPERTFGVLPYIGGSKDLGEYSPSLEGLTIGVAATAPNLYGATLPEDGPTSYFFIDGYFITIAAMAGAGYRVNDWLAVGFNLAYNYLQLKYGQNFSIPDVLGPEELGNDQAFSRAVAESFGDLRLDYTGSDHGLGWTLSALVTPANWVSIGFGYTGQTNATFTGDVSVRSTNGTDVNSLLGSFDFKLPQRLEVEMVIPPAVYAGVNFKVTDWLEIGVDYRLWLYNIFEEQVYNPIYDPDEPGEEPITREDLTQNKEYSVSYEVGGGFLVRPWQQHQELELMLGFGYDKSPVPDRTFSLDNPSMNQLVFTGGVRWFASEGLRASATYMNLQYLSRDVTDSVGDPPLNARGSGTNHMPRIEFEYLF